MEEDILTDVQTNGDLQGRFSTHPLWGIPQWCLHHHGLDHIHLRQGVLYQEDLVTTFVTTIEYFNVSFCKNILFMVQFTNFLVILKFVETDVQVNK